MTFQTGDKVRVKPHKNIKDFDSKSLEILIRLGKIDLRKIYTIKEFHYDSIRSIVYLHINSDIGIYSDCFILEE